MGWRRRWLGLEGGSSLEKVSTELKNSSDDIQVREIVRRQMLMEKWKYWLFSTRGEKVLCEKAIKELRWFYRLRLYELEVFRKGLRVPIPIPKVPIRGLEKIWRLGKISL